MKSKLPIVDDDLAISGLMAIEGRAYGEVSRITGLPLGSGGPLDLRAKPTIRIATSLRGPC